MNTDDEAFMARIIREYDSAEDPLHRADLLESFGIHPAAFASYRQRLARRASAPEPTTEQTPTPPVSPVRRKPRANRRPSTPRGTSGPRTYTFTRSTTQKSRRSGTVRVVTTVTTVVTTTVTTISR
ncbi:hypothetical protein [Streptomyces albidoflavus]|uniref:hypothetical protein n=1 Tax=Streptomyces albidoflavus TaxID=1886 RepID=UPI0033B14336